MAHPVTPNFSRFTSLIQACKAGLEWLPCFCLIVGLALPASALTLHRSFRMREAGFCFGTGKATVAYPVDAKVDKALDEAAEKEAANVKVVIGRCTRVIEGDTIHVVTDGNVKYQVRLDRIDAPEKDQPYGKESTAYFTALIRGKTVRVEWQQKDQYGRVLGIVFLDKADNLNLFAVGNAWHYSLFDKTAEYASAEAEARQNRYGLWSAYEKPIHQHDWRRSKRKT